MSFGLSLSAVEPVAAQAANLPSLAGSWQLTLTPVSPTASVPVRVAALATFTSDGSVIETDATEVVPMMVEGTAVLRNAWTRHLAARAGHQQPFHPVHQPAAESE